MGRSEESHASCPKGQGYFNGSKAPFGFHVEKIATPAGQKNKLVLDRSEAELVREVFRHTSPVAARSRPRAP